jgi:hypothetical protein
MCKITKGKIVLVLNKALCHAYNEIHGFLTSAAVGGDWSASHPCRCTPEARDRSAHWIGGWVNSNAGLDDIKKLKFF